ncbi:hypothetical protein predicted by Glimmer/Critica (plasmid) [Sinorhizobium fredii HH103]|uniref:Uncharacterized protein n=1 Tax=Sinorhizobium fredii (strain HH103) TaxID=1117943 RepID=G9AG31_SINF1|nr:hypothetical protein predicted by Glimmer/Critica [Sinorhizobium fredii HH103]
MFIDNPTSKKKYPRIAISSYNGSRKTRHYIRNPI